MSNYKTITECRVCNHNKLVEILDLGNQALTGVFPMPGDDIETSPIVVVRCDLCGLVQLKHTADLNKMYGKTYGYESSLNSSMVEHLKGISKYVRGLVSLNKGDIILDIGSNDATYLKFFNSSDYRLIGIDPSAEKFKDNYGVNIDLVVDFFSKKNFQKVHKSDKAKLITSIACFYDLESPVKFAQETAEVLDKDGIWFMEMAYLPEVVKNLAFDGYVQEHLLYYTLKDIKNIMNQVGLKIIDVRFNKVNGGSFSVVVGHVENKYDDYLYLEQCLEDEDLFGINGMEIHTEFDSRVKKFKEDFVSLLHTIKDDGKKVYGLGASTKFNTVLQYCGIDTFLLPVIGEVNDYKYGRVTPGTNIPIASEKDVLESKPDYLVVGPYHFRDAIINKYKKYLDTGGKLIFPLPTLEVYSND